MNTQENDDDFQINPFTMLLLSDEQEGEKESPALDSDAPNQHLQRHHIKSIESTVVIRQIPSEGISFQLWPAAASLVSLLDHHRLDPSTSPLSATLSSHRRLRILELGAGTGLVGISAAAALGADVTVTDLHRVLPNLQFNVDANSDLVSNQGGTVHVAPLCWGEMDLMEDIKNREYDLILGSDVVYHDHLYDPLIRTLRFLLLERGESSSSSNVVFLMAHLRRWKKESAFFKKANKFFQIEIIHKDVPSNGSRIGVVLYRFVRKACTSSNLKVLTKISTPLLRVGLGKQRIGVAVYK